MNFSPKTTTTCLLASVTLCGVLQANAQDQAASAARPGIVFELGAAGKVTPSYFGSSKLILSPTPLFRMKRLTLPNGFTIGGGSEEGFSLSPALEVISERSVKDSPELAGLNTIDTAVELGVAAKYQMGHFRIMGEVRRGFGGHEGFRGGVLRIRPSPIPISASVRRKPPRGSLPPQQAAGWSAPVWKPECAIRWMRHGPSRLALDGRG